MQRQTRFRSTAMRILASRRLLALARTRARFRRTFSLQPPTVHYFHQVDDPYSHLAVQKLDELKRGYRLRFAAHLVSGPAPEFQGSSEDFAPWALRDALSVAGDYGVTLEAAARPTPEAVARANDALAAHLDAADFAGRAIAIGSALWAGDSPEGGRPASASGGAAALREGDALRQRLGHYLGAMFYFEGEWFWGIDRIRSLERRLIDEGYSQDGRVRVPEPAWPDLAGAGARHVRVEYFPSLRSPYTAVGHRRVLELAARSGVEFVLRPVMPMMMRGVPAPFFKQRYIITDAAREARERGVPFGRFVDPFGEPVRRAFALFPGASALGRGLEFVTAYLEAAWSQGIDITTETGLRRVAETAGIDWEALQSSARDRDWEAVLDANLAALKEAGLWGVPSFRVSGGTDPEPYACWGQDRIWRVAREIARRA